ncbi:MAG: DNA repair protein RecO [Bdellovibrionales bacterium]|nr:DNA repair protein RecO [Bdellovibrionales bacterium]
MSIHKDKVIVLKQNRFSETDLIVRVLNQNGALLSFIAKGAVKSRRRFIGGVLEPGNFIGVEYKYSRSSSLHFLCQAWFLKRFGNLRKDYDRLHLALYFLSLVEKISQEGIEDSPELFHLLGNGLKALETSDHLPSLQFIFEFRLLLNQGVLPQELQTQKILFDLTIREHEHLLRYITFVKKWSSLVQAALDRYVCGR